jgi:hypothetical protein
MLRLHSPSPGKARQVRSGGRALEAAAGGPNERLSLLVPPAGLTGERVLGSNRRKAPYVFGEPPRRHP